MIAHLPTATNEKIGAPVFCLAASFLGGDANLPISATHSRRTGGTNFAINSTSGLRPNEGDANFRINTRNYKTNPIPETNTLAANSHPGLALPTAALYPGSPFANSNTASSLQVCLYDFRIRSRCTGKERDAETGLDYFGARYFSGAQGRFTIPDLLLNSGRPDNPQSWNRYAYTLNNPLRFTDPTGLYEWAASGCASGNKDCQKAYKARQKEFKDSLSYLKLARDSYDKGSREYKRLNAALEAYGQENKANGVTVGFGALDKDAAGRTTPSAGLASFSVMFDPDKMGAAKDFAVDVGHEGTHVADFTKIRGGESSLSDFSIEYRGYETSAFVFQGLYTPSLSASSPGTIMGGVQSRTLSVGGNIIWNTSWAVNDAATLQSRDTAITKQVTEHYGHTETKPHNPWGN